MRTDEELGLGAEGDVVLKDAVGIVEERDNDGEAGKERGDGGIEGCAPGEKAGEGSGLDGVHRVGEASGEAEAGDMRIAEDFDAGRGSWLAGRRKPGGSG